MKRINKLLALLLCAAVIFSTILVQGFASETETADTSELTQPEAEPAGASENDALKVEEAGGETAPGVAKLASTGEEFKTLQAAFDAAKTALEGDSDAEKIVLLDNTTECVKLSWLRSNGSMTLTIDLNGYTVTGDGTSSVMTFSGATNTNNYLHIVIEDSSESKTGSVTGGSAATGGAIRMDNAKNGDSLTINGGNFYGNTATSSGGAIYCATLAPITINGGNFYNNTAKSGGAIYAYKVIVTGGTITGNSATGTDKFTGRGGGIALWGTSALELKVTGGQIYGNTAARYGDDIVFCSTNKTTASMTLLNAADMGVKGVDTWCIDGYYGSYSNEALLSDRYNAETNVVAFEDYASFGGKTAKGIAVALKAGSTAPAAPEAPHSENTNAVVIFECMTNGEISSHGAASMGFTFDEKYCTVGEVYENADGKWACDVTVDLQKYYDEMVGYADEEAGLPHRLTNDVEINTRVMTAIWDEEEALWIFETVTFETTCVPENFTLTLDPNGGNVDPASITVTYDAAIGALPVPTKVNCIFDGWYDAAGNKVTAETIYTVADDSTITAKWIQYPGKSSTNVTKELFTIQCTVNHEHGWLCNWYGSHVTLVKDSVKWNEELDRWEAQCKIGSSMLNLINLSTTKKNYFGGITHHYDVTNYTFDLYYDPNFTGLNSQSKEVTGMWLPAQEYVVPVYCYTEPAMPNISKITNKALWVRDTDPAFRNKTYSTTYTIKQLIAGTYTLSEMYTEGGKFYVDLTITDLAPYIDAMNTKNGKDYILPDWANHKSASEFKFTLKYNGSTTDYKQDGTGWIVDDASYANNKEKLNGMSMWLTEQFTVTYTDGVEDKEFFADEIFTVTAFSENGGTSDDWADFSVTATPAIEDPSFVNYIFNGWTPAVAETVTETVTYTAQWIQYPGKSSTNVTKELFTIQCTVNHEHSWLCNWFGSHVTFVKDSVKWNEELGRWEAQCKIGSSMMGLINSSTTKKNYFGGITHHYDVTNYTFDLYYDPNFTGLNSQSKEVTGMWLPAQEYVVPVYCYTEPAMPNISKITNKALWVRDTDPAFRNKTYSTTYTIKQLIAGTYTLSEMYTEGGKFYVDLTITDLAPYIDAMNTKNGKDYILPDWANHKSAGEFKFTLKYNGSTTDYKQDGTGWIVDDASYANNKEKLNGMSMWLTEQYTVTYTDGVEKAEVFADQTFTVTAFSENGATKDDWADFTATATPAVDAPTRTGYTFAGWTPEVAATVTDNATYTAKWTANEYTLTLDANGGKVEPATLTVTYDAAIGTLPAPERTGYTFNGWFDAEGNEVTAETVYTVAGDSTVTAKWTANKYTLTLDANGGKVETATLTVTFDAAIGTLPAPERTGYTFNGWFDAEGNEVTAETVYTIAGDSTVTAKWSANQYTLTLDANGGKVEPATLTVTFDAAIGTLPAPERTGYTFNGWFDAEGNEVTAETVYTIAGDSTVTAKWSANQYTLTLDANGGKVDPATLTVTYDAAIGTLPAPERTGYTFNGWFDAEGNEVTAETVYTTAAGSTITAQWVAKTYTVTLVPNGGKVSHTTITVTYDAPIGTLPLPKRDGYFFGCWVFNNVAFTADTIYTNDGDMKLYASWFAKTYTLTLDAGEGTVDPATLTVTFDAAIGTLPTPKREGYTFEGWFDAEGKEVTAETVYTTTDNSTVTAKWTANKYTLTLDNGEQIEVAYGQPIGNLPTPEREGYTFEGWFDANGNEVTAETVYTGDGTMTLTAKWSANGYAIKLEPGEGALNEGDPDLIGVTYGAPVGEMPVPVYEGYIFMGWYDEDGVLVAEDTVYMYNGGITAYAEWEQIPEETKDYTIYIVIALVVIAGTVVAVVVTKKRAVK